MKELKLKVNQKIQHSKFPVHCNPIRKYWAGKVVNVDTDAKYPVELDWLPKTYMNNEDIPYYDCSELTKDDIIKVNGGSRNNHYPQYYRIEHIDDEKLKIEKLSETEVIEVFNKKQESETDKLRKEVINKVKNLDNEEKLREIKQLF